MDACLAQLDRAFGYGPKGRGFESSSTHTLFKPGTRINVGLPLFYVYRKMCSPVFAHLGNPHKHWAYF